MGINVSKPTPIIVYNMSLVLNATNTGINQNKKTVALIHNVFRDNIVNNVVEVSKIQTINNFAYLFNKPLASNEFHGFYHECMVNG